MNFLRMNLKNIRFAVMVLMTTLILASIYPGEANSEPSKKRVEPIRVGMTTALSGPAKQLGHSMLLGIEAYFSYINQQGGVHGRPLELITYDDGYNPNDAANNMLRLVDTDKVIAVIGNVGTPTAKLTVPIANQHKTLLFGAFSGANVLRQSPPQRYIFNYRASYEQETYAMIEHIFSQGIKPTEIAFFTQNDEFGDAGYQGAIKALNEMGFEQTEQLVHGRYTRNTQNVESALWQVYSAPLRPKAIIIIGAYNAAAKFIQLARPILHQVKFYNISFVGSVALANALHQSSQSINGAEKEEQEDKSKERVRSNEQEVYITQVVPNINAKDSGVQQYRQLLERYQKGAKRSFVSLEAFLMTKVFVAALQNAKQPLTREGLVDAVQSLQNLDIGINEKVSFEPGDHQASDHVYTTKIVREQIISIDM